MPRYFKARRAREMRAFLVAHSFYLISTHGDDDIYVRKGYSYTVKIPNRDNDEIPKGTMSHIVKCIRMCGVDNTKKVILQWWQENKYGE